MLIFIDDLQELLILDSITKVKLVSDMSGRPAFGHEFIHGLFTTLYLKLTDSHIFS